MTDLQQISKDTTVTYYYDALCGWCFGFAPAFAQFHELVGDQAEFNVVSGGLFGTNPNKMPVGRVNDAAPHIKNGAYKSVEERTGVRFGQAFLDDVFGEGKMTLDSLYPAIAMSIVKEHAPSRVIGFSKMLNDAVYVDGMDPIDIGAYGPYAEKVGLDSTSFVAAMADARFRDAAEREFDDFASSGARVFPTVILEDTEGKVVLAEGQAALQKLRTGFAKFTQR